MKIRQLNFNVTKLKLKSELKKVDHNLMKWNSQRQANYLDIIRFLQKKPLGLNSDLFHSLKTDLNKLFMVHNNYYSLLFADDLVLLSSTESGLQRGLNSFAIARDTAGMKISSTKIE